MKLPTVKHTLFEGDRWGKRVLMQLRKKGVRKKFYQSEFVFQVIRHHHQMRTVSLGDVIPQPKIVLENFSNRFNKISINKPLPTGINALGSPSLIELIREPMPPHKIIISIL